MHINLHTVTILSPGKALPNVGECPDTEHHSDVHVSYGAHAGYRM